MDVLFNSLQGFGGNETWYTLRSLFFSGFLVIEQEMLLSEADVPCVAVGSLLLLYGLLACFTLLNTMYADRFL